MKKKKICVVTTSRADYGLLRWLMQEIKEEKTFQLQIIASGTHLSCEFGFTFREIEKDGFKVDKKIPLSPWPKTQVEIVKRMGESAGKFAQAFSLLKPDIVVVLGDRYELLSVCSACVVMGIPLAHISGGDITEGAIDNQIRQAITKMAHLHFPGTKDSARRIIQMGELPERVFTVGELGLTNFKRLKRLSRKELATHLDLDARKRWIIFTYHPETLISLKKNLLRLHNALKVLAKIDAQVIMTYPNADFGSQAIIKILQQANKKEPKKFKLFKSLGQLTYTNLMRQAYCMVGNSSSGIFESPLLKLPVINIGSRQKGRIMTENILNVEGSYKSIKQAFKVIERENFRRKLKKIKNPYGNGRTAEKIVQVLKKIDFSKLNPKIFYNALSTKQH